MSKKKLSMALLAILFLFNPNINIIDILPDCIAYLLLIKLIGNSANIIPYMQECKEALSKLAIISLVKIPAMLVMFANVYSGKDIIPLFTFIFSALELIFLYSAISNGISGLCYLGERSENGILIKPFTIGAKKIKVNGTKKICEKKIDIEEIKKITCIFVTVKAVLCVIPELCLLTFSNSALKRNALSIYPLLLIICILSVLLFGIVWLITSRKYIKYIAKNASLAGDIKALAGTERLDEIESKGRVKKYYTALTLLAVSSLFTFDLTFKNFGNINILPHFIYGIILLFAVYPLTSNKRMRMYSTISTSAYIFTSVLTYIFTVRFFDKYDYRDLYSNNSAITAYYPIKIFGVIETLSLIIMIISFMKIFTEFIKNNTYLSPDDKRYSNVDKDGHKALNIKAICIFSAVILINILKCIEIFLKSKVDFEFHSSSGNSALYTVVSPFPWLGTLIFGISVILSIFTLTYVSEIKNSVITKYQTQK